jgi:hypothetical protein
VSVEIGPESDSPKHALVHIAVTGSEKVGQEEEECWRLEFTEDPASVPPGGLQERRIFLVSRHDGQAERHMTVPATKNNYGWNEVPRYGPLRLSLGPSSRFPAEILPAESNPPATYSDGHGSQMFISREQVLEVRILDPEGRLKRRVRQVWPAGAKWWSEYESWGIDGRPVLRARLVTPGAPVASPPPVKNGTEARAHEAALRKRLDTLLREIRWPDAPELNGAPATAIRRQLDAAFDAEVAAKSKAFQRWAHQRAKEEADARAEARRAAAAAQQTEADDKAGKPEMTRPEG